MQFESSSGALTAIVINKAREHSAMISQHDVYTRGLQLSAAVQALDLILPGSFCESYRTSDKPSVVIKTSHAQT